LIRPIFAIIAGVIFYKSNKISICEKFAAKVIVFVDFTKTLNQNSDNFT
jgi:hypothetical protein